MQNKKLNTSPKTSILIVLYSCEITNSKTVQSLLSCNFKFDSSKLILWNNGPVSLKDKNVNELAKLGFDIEIIETIHNESLAVIYNYCLDTFDSEKLVILDHDTMVNNCFLKVVFDVNNEYLCVPIIKMADEVKGPYVNKKIAVSAQQLDSESMVMAIGSGLIIGRSIADKLKKHYGSIFDERFYLYGVDSTFFHRINHLKIGGNIKIIGALEHSLSRYEIEHEKITKFRLKERSYDFALQLRYYYPVYKSCFLIVGTLFKSLYKKATNRKQSINVIDFIKAFFIGKHYRSR